jgi:peptidoglycan biosynthesis protein MviN/MurJ (putative lipid II flippase)
MKRQLLLVFLLTGLSQLAAFFKLWFTAKVFGLDSSLDGYNLALVFPTLISGILSGVLQTGFFPVRAQWATQHNHDPDSIASFERTVLVGYGALGLAVTSLLAATIQYWTPLFGNNASPSAQAAMQQAASITVWLISLNLVGDCTGFMLAMRNRFGIAAAAPIANGLFGGMLLGLWPEGGLSNLLIGTLFGLAIQVSICLIGLKGGGFRFFGKWPEYVQIKKSWHDMYTLGAWIIPGVVFSNIVVSLPPVWIASFGDGAVSAYGYAYRLHSATLQLLVIAGSTVILARFSQLVAAGDSTAVNDILKKASVASVILGGLALLLIWNLGVPLLEFVFDGRFDAVAAERVSQHWLWMTFGLGFSILGSVFAKLWQAQGRPKLISAFSALSLLTLTASYYLLRNSINEFSLGASLSLSATAVVLFGLCFLKPPVPRQ